MGASQRRKGAAAEREFLALLGAELGAILERNLTQTRAGGADSLSVSGWAIEVKRHERLSRPAWWRQAVKQARDTGRRAMLAYRRSREPWTVWIERGDQCVEVDIAEAASVIRESWL